MNISVFTFLLFISYHMFIKSYHASPVYGNHGNKGWYGVEGEDEDGVGKPCHGTTQEL